MTGHVEWQRKVKQSEQTSPTERWYTPIQLRPWVVRAMGYRPKTGKTSANSHKSPFRQFIEDIVTEKIAEHLGADTATSSSKAADNASGEGSSTESTTEESSAAADLVHNLEETLATLSRAEEGLVYPHESASTDTAQHARGTSNPPALQFPIPKNPTSSRRKHRKGRLGVSLLDFLMPDLVKQLDSARHPASASASQSIAGEQRQGHGVRSDHTQSDRRNMWPWHSKRKSRDRQHRAKQQEKGKYHRSASDRAGMNRKNRSKDEKHDEEEEGQGEGVTSDETSESESSSISVQVGVSDDDRLTQSGGIEKSRRTEMNFPNSEERRTESGRGKGRSRDKSRGRSRGPSSR